jgi:hypothetical protein
MTSGRQNRASSRRPHLRDDLIDGNIGTKIVTRNRNPDAMGIQSACEVAEKRTVQRLPVTAVNEHDHWTVAIGGK